MILYQIDKLHSESRRLSSLILTFENYQIEKIWISMPPHQCIHPQAALFSSWMPERLVVFYRIKAYFMSNDCDLIQPRVR